MFDGVHLGHTEILKNVVTKAKEKGLFPAILTFSPHPRAYFSPTEDFPQLSTLGEKKKLMEALGIEYFIIREFSAEFQQLSPEAYIEDFLIGTLNAQHIFIGHDHTFGKGKSGNFGLLKNYSQTHALEVEQTYAVEYQGLPISSSRIRKALETGDILSANAMLGRGYEISGEVIHGKKLGRTIGYPTANLNISKEKLLPKKGAYIVEVYFGQEFYKGMLSIGTNPTVGGTELSVEVYILDFNQDIYAQNLRIVFRDFLHEEIRFNGIDELIQRLDEDKKITKDFLF